MAGGPEGTSIYRCTHWSEWCTVLDLAIEHRRVHEVVNIYTVWPEELQCLIPRRSYELSDAIRCYQQSPAKQSRIVTSYLKKLPQDAHGDATPCLRFIVDHKAALVNRKLRDLQDRLIRYD